jgi:hypothetical protein
MQRYTMSGQHCVVSQIDAADLMAAKCKTGWRRDPRRRNGGVLCCGSEILRAHLKYRNFTGIMYEFCRNQFNFIEKI